MLVSKECRKRPPQVREKEKEFLTSATTTAGSFRVEDNACGVNAVESKGSASSANLRHGGGGTSVAPSLVISGSDDMETNTYDALKVVGHGSFGCVFLAKVLETEEVVAIKKVLQDKKFKNRELQIMKLLSKSSNPHPFILTLKNYFCSHSKDESPKVNSSSGDDMTEDSNDTNGKEGDGAVKIYLNLVLEYLPETVYSLTKHYARQKQVVPIEHARIYMYQLGRALSHIHSLGICHRDVKPQNLLIDPETFTLKLCDFGSSKVLVGGEPNIAYICSRYYRAPELIFGSNDYTTIIDLWSFGCVLAELLLGCPMFPGATGVDHLVEIIKVLGAPHKDDLKRMNPNYQEFKFPNIRAHVFHTLFPANTDRNAIELVEQLLKYVPEKRLTAIETLTTPFFLPALCHPDYEMPTQGSGTSTPTDKLGHSEHSIGSGGSGSTDGGSISSNTYGLRSGLRSRANSSVEQMNQVVNDDNDQHQHPRYDYGTDSGSSSITDKGERAGNIPPNVGPLCSMTGSGENSGDNQANQANKRRKRNLPPQHWFQFTDEEMAAAAALSPECADMLSRACEGVGNFRPGDVKRETTFALNQRDQSEKGQDEEDTVGMVVVSDESY